ncbi:MAG: hypothetical protein OEM02_12065 [Desulfobulbaceae bacterium]|nr:hypothetical protein [Desulfobulbaceae bacterium]
MAKNETLNEFTILDWIGFFYILVHISGLFYFSEIAFNLNEMYQNIGKDLPTLTIIVLKPWFSTMLGIICLGIFSLQLINYIKISLKRRRAVVVLSFIISSVFLALCTIGAYQPIFRMAEGL